MSKDTKPPDLNEGLVGNLLILAAFVYAFTLNIFRPDVYYTSVQEDEFLEWMTFWGFMIAAVVFFVGALRQRRAESRLPWFQFGVALFCFVVAMEEISWAQRWLLYRPPDYFLENNFQQELNVHNVMSTDLRKLGVKTTILGYGVVLPVIALVSAGRDFLSKLTAIAPPAALIPSFFIMYLTYGSYPWDFAGEIVELMLAVGMLVGAVYAAARFAPEGARLAPSRRLTAMALAFVLTLGLGVATAAASRLQRSSDADRIRAAEIETEALKQDFLDSRGRPITRCGRHKRVYTYVVDYDVDELDDGEFAALQAGGLPEARVAYFIDPWNLPYWIRDRCDSDREIRSVFVYSFGPNRRRDSTRWKILGDDVGAEIYQVGVDQIEDD